MRIMTLFFRRRPPNESTLEDAVVDAWGTPQYARKLTPRTLFLAPWLGIPSSRFRQSKEYER